MSHAFLPCPHRWAASVALAAFAALAGCTGPGTGSGGPATDASGLVDTDRATESPQPDATTTGTTEPGDTTIAVEEVAPPDTRDASDASDTSTQPPDTQLGDETQVAPGCGDHHCAAGESCSSCPGDCGFCAPKCGDGKCEAGELCSTCPGDCGVCANVGDCCFEQAGPGCGDKDVRECTCAVSPICCNERWDSICAYTAAVFGCATRCTNFCGDGDCSRSFEDATSCPADCKSKCGDGVCQSDESPESCATDCGYPHGCCTATYEAGCNVPSIRDCVCAYDSYCCTSWDWACTQYVELQMCGDCGSNACGDGTCDANENCKTCARDCGECTGGCFLDSVACTSDDECCSGFCGGLTGCIGNAPCKNNGQSCAGNIDCCSAECGPGGTCIAPTCKALGVPCGGASECCSGACDGHCQMGGSETCGNHQCAGGETCSSCPGDCGTCTGPSCGDHACNGEETCGTCPGDCGPCTSTQCNGDWTLGQTFYVDTHQGLGQACAPQNAPKNCYDGTYIMFPNDTCYCILACPNGFAIGDACTDDGSWTCQHIQATNPNANQMMACVPKTWNLCTQ